MGKFEKKRIIRIGICLFWVFLFVQYFIAKDFRELYPAILFPSFARVLPHQKKLNFLMSDSYLYTDANDSTKVHTEKLFSGLLELLQKNGQLVKPDHAASSLFSVKWFAISAGVR